MPGNRPKEMAKKEICMLGSLTNGQGRGSNVLETLLFTMPVGRGGTPELWAICRFPVILIPVIPLL